MRFNTHFLLLIINKKLMRNLEEVFNKVKEIKKEQKKIRDMYRDALSHSAEYREVMEEMGKIKDNKKQIETNMQTNFSSEMDKLSRLKQEIADNEQMLSDIAMTQYAEGKNVEIKDEYDNVYEPIFSVKFKKV